jgi:hypothetical protein
LTDCREAADLIANLSWNIKPSANLGLPKYRILDRTYIERRKNRENEILVLLPIHRSLHFVNQHLSFCAGNDFERPERSRYETNDASRFANLRYRLSSEWESDERGFNYLCKNSDGMHDPMALAYT